MSRTLSSFYDIVALKKELYRRCGETPYNSHLNITNQTYRNIEYTETLDTLEEVYWVEEGSHNPWVMVRGARNVVLFCPTWVNGRNNSAYYIRCPIHDGPYLLGRMFPSDWPCACGRK